MILPCIAALCISITIKMMIISVENGMTAIIFDTIPATKFWIPIICVLLLSTIIASVLLFQKLVQYNEETGKRAILENQVRQMQKEIIEIQDIYTDMRGLRHDMRSHIVNISLLVKNMTGAVNKEIERYIGKMEETVNKLDFTYQTGNPITDIIIHQKWQEVVDNIKSMAAAHGAKVLSCSITMNGYDSMTTEVCVKDEVDPGTEKARKELEERIKERKEEKKAQEEKAAKRREEKKAQAETAAERRAEKKEAEEARNKTGEYTIRVTGTDIKTVTQKLMAAASGTSAPTGASFDIRA